MLLSWAARLSSKSYSLISLVSPGRALVRVSLSVVPLSRLLKLMDKDVCDSSKDVSGAGTLRWASLLLERFSSVSFSSPLVVSVSYRLDLNSSNPERLPRL